MQYRLFSLLLIPFFAASALLAALALSNLKNQLLIAEANLAQTLIQTSTNDAATYFAQNDWVALSAVLENLSGSIEQTRAEIIDSSGQVILAKGQSTKTGQTFESALLSEGQTLGILTLTTSGEAIETLVFETGVLMAFCVILLASAIALFLAQFGDFVRIWIGLDPPRAAPVKNQQSAPLDRRVNGLEVLFAIKLTPSRLAPLSALHTLTQRHEGRLSTIVAGDYEARFAGNDAIASGLLFYEGLKTLLDDTETLDARFALGICNDHSGSDVPKRTKFLATLSTGELVIDETTQAMLTDALGNHWMIEPFISPLASDLSLSLLKPRRL